MALSAYSGAFAEVLWGRGVTLGLAQQPHIETWIVLQIHNAAGDPTKNSKCIHLKVANSYLESLMIDSISGRETFNQNYLKKQRATLNFLQFEVDEAHQSANILNPPEDSKRTRYRETTNECPLWIFRSLQICGASELCTTKEKANPVLIHS